ncbi:MAG: hypothetical protein JNK79_12990 [Chitinophagaceae bacterium]|nr:hypothetical protein [Chitinophagaceae bacterium]
MKHEYRPIKRSRQLAALSREHHDGLLFVWKIRQGVALNVPAKRIGSYCEWYWQNSMKDHFKKEESALSSLLPESDFLLNTMKEDHQAITVKMEQVIEDATYYSLLRLAQIIYYHIRFEERSLFAHVEQVVPSEKLDEALLLLTEAHEPAEVWTDEFWTKKRANSPGKIPVATRIHKTPSLSYN